MAAVEGARRTLKGLGAEIVEVAFPDASQILKDCFVMDKGRVTAELTPGMLDDRDLVRRHLAV